MIARRRPNLAQLPATDARLRAMKRSLDSSVGVGTMEGEDLYSDLIRLICTRLTAEELRRFDVIERHWGEHH